MHGGMGGGGHVCMGACVQGGMCAWGYVCMGMCAWGYVCMGIYVHVCMGADKCECV